MIQISLVVTKKQKSLHNWPKTKYCSPWLYFYLFRWLDLEGLILRHTVYSLFITKSLKIEQWIRSVKSSVTVYLTMSVLQLIFTFKMYFLPLTVSHLSVKTLNSQYRSSVHYWLIGCCFFKMSEFWKNSQVSLARRHTVS